jgi:hypothetical protein
LAAAAPAQAGYLHKWTYHIADYASGSGGQTSSLTLNDTSDGSSVTGTAQYALSSSAVARIRAGYSGAGTGQVSAGDRADFSWNFQLSDTGTDQLSSLHWDLVGFYDSTSGPLVSQTLASGDGLGSFSGSASLPFATNVDDLNWFGADLQMSATAPPTAGQYSMSASLTGDGIRYAYVPVPEPAGAGVIIMLSCLFARRRRTLTQSGAGAN